MEIGIGLPQMAVGYAATTTVDWARLADQGPFSSISAGERVTFSNPEMVATLGAAAAVTSRIRIFANLWVLPYHPAAMVAQQIGTLDQLSGGRLSVAVGVGGREHDYQAVGRPFDGRHGRLDRRVAELKDLLAGVPPFEGADPVGPAITRTPGPEILAGAMGPKSMARAARWADGVSGFSIAGKQGEIARTNSLAVDAWAAADRDAPRLVSGCFFALGVADPLATLRAYCSRYLAFLGPELAEALARETTAASPDEVRRVLDDAEAAGCHEFVLVPASTDLRCLEAAAELVSSRGAAR